ncbi:MAG TPA: dipeptide epimerase [Candidatus Methanofastidiosa archaeon]|nr:dipeptide epimerase [Candidatus Methanofastidiosa archaeon]
MQIVSSVKIEEIDFTYRKIPLERAFSTATGGVSNSSSFFVRVTTNEGITGYGCGYPTSMTDEDVRSANYYSELFREGIKGIDPLRREKVCATMDSITYGNPAVKFAFDTAIWDIIGKYHDSPLYGLLGNLRPKMATSITIGLDDVSSMLRDAMFWRRKGFDHFKVKLGPEPDRDIEVLFALRDELGPEPRIRCDANGSLSLPDARKVVMRTRDLDIEFFEQPARDDASMLELTTDSPIRIAGDESIHDRFQLQSALQRKLFHIANIKLNRFGGISQGIKMINSCELSEVPCMVGCMSENAISIAASLHLALSSNNVLFADLDTYLFLKHQPATGLNLKKGFLSPSEDPGLGVNVDKKIFKKARPS